MIGDGHLRSLFQSEGFTQLDRMRNQRPIKSISDVFWKYFLQCTGSKQPKKTQWTSHMKIWPWFDFYKKENAPKCTLLHS